jgi:ATP-binding cassette, subfamily F, member 3
MALISLSHVGIHFGGPHLFREVTLGLERGWKVGVVGPNGSGKSSLLKILAGELRPSEGQVFAQRGLRLAYQAQELVVEAGRTVREEMRGIFATEITREARLRELEQALGGSPDEAKQGQLLREYSRLQEEHESGRGYGVEQRIASTLSGLGLPEEAWDQPIDSFSGGERNIIGLARILLDEPDVILLDEPSNHLDIDGLEWFLRWMRSSPATIAMVSHDRHLLDLTVERIWEIGSRKVTSWTGNFSKWREQKEDALALQERQYKNQQRTIRRLEFQARRLRDMARAYDEPKQARRAQSILHRIEQMELIEKPDAEAGSFRATLGRAERHGRIALEVQDFSFAFGDRVIFEEASLAIEYGQRVCLVGPNGCGKTTLMREILRQGSWENPILRLGKSVRVGDYNQIHQEVMEGGTKLIDWLMERTGLLFQPASELLHRFLFRRGDLERRIDTLSGGEKSRLQLARLVEEKVNFLLLDEPTNHLDIGACEQLEEMLEEFEGTLLVISHDRWFLDRIAGDVVEIRDRKLVHCGMSFGKWWSRRRAEGERGRPGALGLHSRQRAAEAPRSDNRLRQETVKANQRERRRLERAVHAAEERVGELEARQEQLNRELEDIYSGGGDGEGAPLLAEELKRLPDEVTHAVAAWEEVAAQLEDWSRDRGE